MTADPGALGATHAPGAIDAPGAAFERLHAAARADLAPDWPVRADRLRRLQAALQSHRTDLAAAISADFGHRAAQETELYELFPCLNGLRHALRHGQRWMRPRRRAADWWAQPGHCRLVPQPLGVVGIVSPWNYPLYLSVGPLTDALVAGNRALLKPSEYTPRFSTLLAQMLAQRFDATEVGVVQGGGDIAAAFCALPFDHLLFTGSTAVGRRVMAAASGHLTPVTLELGGKSPALIGPTLQSGPQLDTAVQRILVGKLLNAGQTCIAPDYALVPRRLVAEFVTLARQHAQRFYPALASNPHYTRLINAAQFTRLQAWVDEACTQGATAVPLTEAQPDAASRLMPPLLLLDVPPSARVLQEELFGPVLPVVAYDELDDALAWINARPRPLALYLFDHDRAVVERVLQHTVSGGVAINDTLLHMGQGALPFGGIGPSGMGSYHGEAGFRTFSHLKPVFMQSRLNAIRFLRPPYGRLFESAVRLLVGR